MKGLLVKDFKLIMVQKNFFLLIFMIVMGMILFTDDVTFPITFFCFIVSLFTLSTISYDEFDNGNSFLFTLPITRSTYVAEKYCLVLLFGGGAWILATTLGVIATIFKGEFAIIDLILITGLSLLAIIIIQAVVLPFQLKFGGEKARIVMVGVFGVLTVMVTVVVNGVKDIFNVDLVYIFNTLPSVGMGIFVGIAVIISLSVLLISMKISNSIINRKEF